MRRNACFSSRRRTSSMIDSTSFARPFSTTSGSAEILCGIDGSAKVSDCRSRSSSLLMIIGEDLQRPGAGKKKRDSGEFFAQALAGGANLLQIAPSHEHCQLHRRSVAMQPAMLRRERQKCAFDSVAKVRIDVGGMRARLQCANIAGAGGEIVAIGAGGGGGGRALERHLHFISMCAQQRAPTRYT